MQVHVQYKHANLAQHFWLLAKSPEALVLYEAPASWLKIDPRQNRCQKNTKRGRGSWFNPSI
jgi:hypothetical protein